MKYIWYSPQKSKYPLCILPRKFHPSSLAYSEGKSHHGNKSEILDCIVPADLDNQRPVTTAAVLDGAVLIQMLHPGSAVTIRDYFTDVFAPYTLSCLKEIIEMISFGMFTPRRV